jgi:hypothetical protein
MKYSIIFVTIWALAATVLVPHALADEAYYRHRRAQHHRPYRIPIVRIETQGYRVCYPGWWQTVRDGHVSPQWRMYCTQAD